MYIHTHAHVRTPTNCMIAQVLVDAELAWGSSRPEPDCTQSSLATVMGTWV